MSRFLLALLMVLPLAMTSGCATKSAKNLTPAPAVPPSPAITVTPIDPLRGEQGQIREETIVAAPQTVMVTEPSSSLEKPTLAGLQVVPFAYDQHLLSDEAKEIIAANAAILKATGRVKFQLAGHCDERGSDQYNISLGERRAEAVQSYLLELGIDARRMETVSFGEERPVNPGHNEECWVQNRRVEFVLLP